MNALTRLKTTAFPAIPSARETMAKRLTNRRLRSVRSAKRRSCGSDDIDHLPFPSSGQCPTSPGVILGVSDVANLLRIRRRVESAGPTIHPSKAVPDQLHHPVLLLLLLLLLLSRFNIRLTYTEDYLFAPNEDFADTDLLEVSL